MFKSKIWNREIRSVSWTDPADWTWDKKNKKQTEQLKGRAKEQSTTKTWWKNCTSHINTNINILAYQISVAFLCIRLKRFFLEYYIICNNNNTWRFERPELLYLHDPFWISFIVEYRETEVSKYFKPCRFWGLKNLKPKNQQDRNDPSAVVMCVLGKFVILPVTRICRGFLYNFCPCMGYEFSGKISIWKHYFPVQIYKQLCEENVTATR